MTTTADRLVAAAADLLDAGGESAVTLRAVGAAIGVSHNAPYKHFAGRDDLLAAVATRDFVALADALREVRASIEDPRRRLLEALDVAVALSREHPARYRLLFSSPSLAARGGAMADAARTALERFAEIVEDAQAAGVLPAGPSNDIAVLVFATTHGLIDADASGRLRPQTGWAEIGTGLELLTTLLGGHQR